MKILIIRFSSIGDIVLTTPVIRILKNQLKDITNSFNNLKANVYWIWIGLVVIAVLITWR